MALPAEPPPPILQNPSYLVLIADASRTDASITELLPPEIAGTVIGESSQWVLLDDFDELQRVPLTEYRDRIEPFDPRNDGYAERLRAFFIQDNQRFLFIPYTPDVQAVVDQVPGIFDESISWTLIPHFSTGGTETPVKPVLVYLSLSMIAGMITLICSKNRGLLLGLYPIIAALSLIGAIGMVLGTVLYTLAGIVLPSVQEWFVSHRYKRYVHTDLFRNRVAIACMVAPVLYGVLCMVFHVLPVLGIAGFVCFFMIFFVTLWTQSSQGKAYSHIRFMPVPIAGFSAVRPVIPRTVIPVAVAALVALFVPSVLPAPVSITLIDDFNLIDQATLIPYTDYESHAFFQSTFSLFSLGAAVSDRTQQQYTWYHLDGNGLIAQAENTPARYEIPPFPLGNLMEFLEHYQNPEQVSYNPPPQSAVPWGLIPVMIIILICCIPLPAGIPLWHRSERKQSSPVYSKLSPVQHTVTVRARTGSELNR
jgi:hypothetical protein